jgi:putative transposase
MRAGPEWTLARPRSCAQPGCVSRKVRVGEPGSTFHVWANGVANSFIFRDGVDRDWMLRLLREETRLSRWTCLSYVVMSSHYHLMLRLNEPTLSSGFQRLNYRYALHHNRRYAQRGHCFEQRFQSIPVGDAEDELETARYLALNPTRAEMCRVPEDWPWSSYGAVVGLYPRDRIIDLKAALVPAGGSQKTYRAFVEAVDPRLRRC